MADAVWLVGREGQQFGPFTTDDLRAKLARGEVAPTDLVWREGMANWVAASAVPELQPPPPQPVSVVPMAEQPSGAMWLIGRGGQQLGPYSTADVQAMAASGQVARGDLLWREGMAEWKPLAEVPEFAGVARSMPPAMPTGPAAPPFAPAGPSPAAQFFSEFLADTMAIAKDPDAGSAAVADKKPVLFSCIWLGLAVFVVALLALQLNEWGVFLFVGGPRGLEGPSGIAVFFKSILCTILHHGLWFGALILTLGPILKSKAIWQDVFTILGLSSIPFVLVGFVAFVFAWLHPCFYVLMVGSHVAGLLLLYHLFVHTGQVSRRLALYAVPAIYLATAIVLGIFARLMMA